MQTCETQSSRSSTLNEEEIDWNKIVDIITMSSQDVMNVALSQKTHRFQFRKSSETLLALEQAYLASGNQGSLSKEQREELGKKIGLWEKQIYNWMYAYRQKEEKRSSN